MLYLFALNRVSTNFQKIQYSTLILLFLIHLSFQTGEITDKRKDTLDPRITSYLEGSINSTVTTMDGQRKEENNVNDPPEINAVNAVKVASWQAVNAAKEYGAQQAEKAQQHKADKQA